MKIVQIVLGYYPSQIWGGVTPIVHALSKKLIERGHEVTVIGSNIMDYGEYIKPYTFEDEWEGVPVVYLHTHWRGRRPDSVGFIWQPDIWKYRHLIKEADVLHIQGYRTFLFVATALMALHYKTPIVVQPHGSLPTLFGRVGLKRVFDKTIGPYILRRIRGAVAQSDEEITAFTSYGVPKNIIKKIYNPFEPPTLPQLQDDKTFRERYSIPTDSKLILFLSRLHVKKGLDLLIDAFAQLQHPHVYLCIVGPDDGFEERARAQVAQLGIEAQVTFTGPLYDEAKWQAYHAADVYVLPTRGVEGLPQTVVEALYAATPVVITRTTEVSQLVDQQAGIAIDFDLQALVHALDNLIDDPALMQTHATNARALCQQHFDLQTIAAQYETLYRQSKDKEQ